MLFVGRQSEKKIIMEALNCGRNIILGGKFGIGRTRLIREIAKLVNERKFKLLTFLKLKTLILKLKTQFIKKQIKKLSIKSIFFLNNFKRVNLVNAKNAFK